MFQAWNVGELTKKYFSVPSWITGIVLAVLVGGVLRFVFFPDITADFLQVDLQMNDPDYLAALVANRILGGDTLWVRGGTYREKVDFTNANGSAEAPLHV